MISFASDYIAGAHPAVLQHLLETNLENLPGYGADHYCAQAAEKIRQACACPQAQVEFLAGGTQTNAVVISSLLACHEAGAIEYSGHKVLELPPAGG